MFGNSVKISCCLIKRIEDEDAQVRICCSAIGAVRMLCQVDNAIMVVAIIAMMMLLLATPPGYQIRAVVGCHHLQLYVRHDVLLDVVHSVKVGVERVLTSVLLAALRTDDICVLGAKVHVLDVTLQAHLVKIFVAVRTTFAGCRLFVTPASRIGRISVVVFGRRGRRWRVVGHMTAVIGGRVHTRRGSGCATRARRIVLRGS